MKKFLLVLLLVIFIWNPTNMVTHAESELGEFEAKVETITLTRDGIKTQITLEWHSTKKIEACNVSCEIGGGTREIIFEYNLAGMSKANENCIFTIPDSLSEDGFYHYELQFDIVSGKIGSANLKFEYKFDAFATEFMVIPIIVATGNSNILNTDYAYLAGFIIGVIVTVCIAFGTYLIIQISQTEVVSLKIARKEDDDDE